MRNHIKAGINQSVQGYEWSSGHCYFAGTDILEGCRPVSELGAREYRKVMRSNIISDERFRINSKGYIEPASYTCINFVESCFGRIQSFDYFIYKANSARPKEGPIEFSDGTVIAGLREILNKRFEVTHLDNLKDVLKKEVMLILRRQFNCSPKQLARIMNMSLNEVSARMATDF